MEKLVEEGKKKKSAQGTELHVCFPYSDGKIEQK
jgi:hypothetical protein